MIILAVESSARTASVAIVENGRLLSEIYSNTGLTHSQVLMPMVKSALDCTQYDFSSIDIFAVSNGPGSFTGIRIGVAAVKGMAQAVNKPCIGISTLETIAYNFSGLNCIVCAVMDARCSQVYTALFECENGMVKRITNDSAIMISRLEQTLLAAKYNLPVVFAGDGAEMCYNKLKDTLLTSVLAPENLRFQRAFGSVMAALSGNYPIHGCSAINLLPVYLRAPQAERELRKRNEGKTE